MRFQGCILPYPFSRSQDNRNSTCRRAFALADQGILIMLQHFVSQDGTAQPRQMEQLCTAATLTNDRSY